VADTLKLPEMGPDTLAAPRTHTQQLAAGAKAPVQLPDVQPSVV
jgi:hypothetical protein